jgi:peptidoglycan/xylan/chitin deacetylase (PgdA/CDA1 family)
MLHHQTRLSIILVRALQVSGKPMVSKQRENARVPLTFVQRTSLPFIRVLSASKLLDAYELLRRNVAKPSARIVAYHRVGSTYEFPSDVPLVSPEDFEKQIIYLSQRYRVLSLSELGRALSRGTSLPAKTAVITFDDGYKDNYLLAYPILKRYGVPATIFLATGHIDSGIPFWWDRVSYAMHHSNREDLDLAPFGTCRFQSTTERWLAARAIREGLKDLPDGQKNSIIEELVGQLGVDIPLSLARDMFLSWDEVREMSQNGIDFGAHTVNHPTLVGMPLELAREEIVGSQRRIQENLDRPADTFCYPDGRLSNVNDHIKAILRENRFVCAVYGNPDALVHAGTDPYEMGRLSPRWDFSTFHLSVCGLYPDLMALRHRLRTS